MSEVSELEKFQTAKVTIGVTQGHKVIDNRAIR